MEGLISPFRSFTFPRTWQRQDGRGKPNNWLVRGLRYFSRVVDWTDYPKLSRPNDPRGIVGDTRGMWVAEPVLGSGDKYIPVSAGDFGEIFGEKWRLGN
jgi:hypothetical protein